jgi:uncharacterized protein involved in exopolysaccharide biosynthesis
MKQEVLTTLTREYEAARLQEANDLPGIALLDEPSVPVDPSGPKVVLVLALAAVASVGIAIVTTWLSTYLAIERLRTPGDWNDLAAAWAFFRRRTGPPA